MFPFKKINDLFVTSNKIAIISHVKPDTDAFCSLVALKLLLNNNYTSLPEQKKIDIFAEAEEINDFFMPILKNDNLNLKTCESYDLAIAVDCPSLERLGQYEKIFLSAKNTLNIDHHNTNERFANQNLLLKCSSCCEAIYLIFKALQKNISDDICKLVYASIITDTANLTQGNIQLVTFKNVAEIMARDLNLESIQEYFIKSDTKSKAFLLEKALHSLSFFENDRIAIMKITRQDLIETNSTQEDTMGIINHAINIKGVDLAVILIKQEDNSYYVSLRSKNGIDVGKIAKVLGGGGHNNMAAFNYKGLLSELKPKLLKTCTEEILNSPPEQDDINLFFGDDD